MEFLTVNQIADLAYGSDLQLNAGEGTLILSFQAWEKETASDAMADYKTSLENVSVLSPLGLEELLENGGYDEANNKLFMTDKGYMSLPSNFWDYIQFHGDNSWTVDPSYYLECNFKW